MPLEICDEGEGNRVEIDDEVRAWTNGTINLRGNGSRVSITGPLSAHRLDIDIAHGSSVRIGAGCFAGLLSLYSRRRGTIEIGSNSSFNGLVRLLLHEPGKIIVGRGCLFAPDIDVVNSDMHSIVDVETGARLNPARDVVIGDGVWIGIKAFIAKGTTIGDGSVIGAYSFVSGEIPAQCIATGVPAKVLRRGVTWKFDLIETPGVQETSSAHEEA